MAAHVISETGIRDEDRFLRYRDLTGAPVMRYLR